MHTYKHAYSKYMLLCTHMQHLYLHTCMHIHTYGTCADMCTHARVYCTCTQIHMCTCIVHMCIHVCALTYLSTHPYYHGSPSTFSRSPGQVLPERWRPGLSPFAFTLSPFLSFPILEGACLPLSTSLQQRMHWSWVPADSERSFLL